MDTLALLCNLYGDGPQTLRRLREAGCGTLAALETLESERLASLLRTSVRSAKRFQAEGRLLRERSELSGERAATRRPNAPPAALPTPPPNPLVASVLTAWRERDALGGDAPRAASAALAVEVPRAPAAAAGEACEGLEGLDGMDAALLARLGEAGVATLEDFREVDVLDLAGRGVAGYTRLLHLQFLARRAGERRPAGAGKSIQAAPAAASAVAPPAPHVEPNTTAQDRNRGPTTLVAEYEAAASAVATTIGEIAPEASAGPLAGDVLVPARPPERRGAGRAATAPVAPAVQRFSPRAEPQEPIPLPLKSDLERHAAGRTFHDALGPGTGTHDDAGSSGPFA